MQIRNFTFTIHVITILKELLFNLMLIAVDIGGFYMEVFQSNIVLFQSELTSDDYY